MSIEAMKLALFALDIVKIHYTQNRHINEAIAALKERLADPMREVQRLGQEIEQEPLQQAIIAGALFDFMGWLTSRKERIVLSSADEASPAVDAIRDFAKMRGLSLDDARVQDWHTTPPQRKPLTDYELTDLWYKQSLDWMEFARAIEAAHGIKENT